MSLYKINKIVTDSDGLTTIIEEDAKSVFVSKSEDVFVTGSIISGTSLNLFLNNGTIINNSLSAFTANTFVTGSSISGVNLNLVRNDGVTLTTSLSAFTANTFVTGATLSGNNFTLTRNDNSGITTDFSFYDYSPISINYNSLLSLVNNGLLKPSRTYYLTNPADFEERLELIAKTNNKLNSTGNWHKFNPDWSLTAGTYSNVSATTGVAFTENKGKYRTIRTILPVAPLIRVTLGGTITTPPMMGEVVYLIGGNGLVKAEGIVAYPYDSVSKKLVIGVTSNSSWNSGGQIMTASGNNYQSNNLENQESEVYVDKTTNLGVLRKYTSFYKDELTMPVFPMNKRTNFYLTDLPHLPIPFQKIVIDEYDGFANGKFGALVLSQPISHPKEIGTGANSAINCIVQLSDGKFLIGGSFTSYDGNTARGICRLNQDGSFDNTFVSGLPTNGTVNAIAVDGVQIYIAGSFSSYSNVQRNNLARVNMNGVLDTAFNLGTSNNKGTNQPINTIIIDGDKIVIGGKFTKYDNIDRNRIARLDKVNGDLDTTFVPAGSGNNQGFNSEVNVIKDFGDSYLCGGGFTSYGSNVATRLVKISKENANIYSNVANVENGAVNTIEMDITEWGAYNNSSGGQGSYPVAGSIYFGGSFTSISNQRQGRISKLNINNSVISVELIQSINMNNGGFDNTINFITFDAAKTGLLCGGSFSKYKQDGVIFKRNKICKINIDGTLDTTYDTGTGANLAVRGLVVRESDSAVVCVGSFGIFNNTTVGRITVIPSVLLAHLNPYSSGDVVVDDIGVNSNYSGKGYYHWQKLPKTFILNSENGFDLKFQNLVLELTDVRVIRNGNVIFQNNTAQNRSRDGLADMITQAIQSSTGAVIQYQENVLSNSPTANLVFISGNPSEYTIEITTKNYADNIKPSFTTDWAKLPKLVGHGYINKTHFTGYNLEQNLIKFCQDTEYSNIVKADTADMSGIIEFPWGHPNWKYCDLENTTLMLSDPNYCKLSNVKSRNNSVIILDDNDTYDEGATACGLINGEIGSDTTIKLKADPFFDNYSTTDIGNSYITNFRIADEITLTIPPGKSYSDVELTNDRSSFRDRIYITENELFGAVIDFNKQFKQSDVVYNMAYLGEIDLDLTKIPDSSKGVEYTISSFVNYNVEWDSVIQDWVFIDDRQPLTTFRLAHEYTVVGDRKEDNIRVPKKRDVVIEPIGNTAPRNFVYFCSLYENPYYPWIKINKSSMGENMMAVLESLKPVGEYLMDISEDYIQFKMLNVSYTGGIVNTFTAGIEYNSNCFKSNSLCDFYIFR
jgi:hypothetical protein